MKPKYKINISIIGEEIKRNINVYEQAIYYNINEEEEKTEKDMNKGNRIKVNKTYSSIIEEELIEEKTKSELNTKKQINDFEKKLIELD